jgi:hypothetical protein
MSLQDGSLLLPTQGSFSRDGTQGGERNRFLEQIAACKRIVVDAMLPPHTWNIPFPLPPATPMLLHHDDVTHMYEYPMHFLEADFDAMSLRVLEEIQPVYYALNPWEMKHMRDHVEMCARRRDERERAVDDAGPRPLVTDPRQDNDLLDDADFALIDVDFDQSALIQRTLPSLSLLKAPLYTEIGLEQPEVRAQRRRQTLASQAGRPSTQLASQVLAARSSTRLNIAPTDDDQWATAVTKTFHNANALQAQYQSFAASVASKLLCLNPEDPETETLARSLMIAVAQPPVVGTATEPLLHRRMEAVSQMVWDVVLAYNADPATLSVDAALDEVRPHFAREGVTAMREWLQRFQEKLETSFSATLMWERSEAFDDASKALGNLLKQSADPLYHQSLKDANRRVLLTHPRSMFAIPVAVLPVAPLPDDVREADEDLTLLLFHGAKPANLAAARSPHIFDLSQLHVPERPLARDDPRSRDDALYRTEASAFKAFKTDDSNAGNYLLVLRDGCAYLRRVRPLQELRRDHDQQVSEANRYVMWDHEDPASEDDDGSVDPPESKRHRTETVGL